MGQIIPAVVMFPLYPLLLAITPKRIPTAPKIIPKRIPIIPKSVANTKQKNERIPSIKQTIANSFSFCPSRLEG